MTDAAILASVDGERGLPRWFPVAFRVMQNLPEGRLDLELPDGRVFRAEGERPGPEGRLQVRNPRLFSRLAREGELGFAEAYLDGWWDSPDLQSTLDVLIANDAWVDRSHPLSGLLRRLRRVDYWLRRNTRSQARRNIAAHYDLGNDFYRLWLDETMTYSSAIFEREDDDLATAQRRKFASVCDRMAVREGAHLLEIGCGWGGFAEFAARERGARVTGLTISREQHDYARKRVFEAGLGERVEIVMRDYRDERGTYDGIASIEMIEAVGEKYWPAYFAAVRDRLGPGAAATIQAITVADSVWPTYRRTVDYVQKYIFPGGMLPSPGAIRAEVARAGLRITGERAFGESYSRTLRRWHRRFEDAWDEIAPMGFDERFRRMWRLYLTACASTFRAGTTDVVQVTLRRA